MKLRSLILGLFAMLGLATSCYEEDCGFYMWCVGPYDDTSLDIYNVATLLSISWSPSWGTWELADPYTDTFTNVLPTLVDIMPETK